MAKKLALNLIKFYQYFISPMLEDNCRFYPSCSEYAKLAIEKYGFFKGTWRGARRVFKCHPFYPGGVDLP